LDHVLTLGPTIADIAWHKAGIIKPGATAVVGDLPAEARSVVVAEARYASVDVVESRARDNPAVHQRTVAFGFQERNAELATAVAMVLARRGFAITPAAINAGIGSARLPGRFEQMRGADHPPVWLDGAHNQDKIVALATEVKKLFTGGPLPVIVVGMLSSKDPTRLLAPLRSAASSLVLTEPAVIGRNSLAVGMLADSVAASGFTGPVHTEPNPDAAMQLAEEIARCEGAAVLVTGSMYLVGQVRRRWYRDRDVVLQRTPWPLANSDS
jgi:dihydrofolate synthase/folylpolyglutamate synthase